MIPSTRSHIAVPRMFGTGSHPKELEIQDHHSVPHVFGYMVSNTSLNSSQTPDS